MGRPQAAGSFYVCVKAGERKNSPFFIPFSYQVARNVEISGEFRD